MSTHDFWDEPQRAQKVIRRLKYLKSICEPVVELDQKLEDLQVLQQLDRKSVV